MMDSDDLDFLPLLTDNISIKQELFEASEKASNLCDSVEEDKIDQQTKSNEVKIAKKCCWCCQTLTVSDRPKLLECFHVSCEQCINAKLQEQRKLQLQSCGVLTAQCPICKMDNRSDYIIENQFLVELLNCTSTDEAGSSRVVEEETVKCSSCSDENPATSWCVECSEYICDSCVQAHQRLKITKDHTIKSKDEADNKVDKTTSKDIKCQMHPQEKLSLFCETCDRLTCRDCQLLDHRDHKYKFANEIASETREKLKGLLSEISYKKVLLSSAMKVIDDRQALIAEKKTELSKEIADLVVKLTNAVNQRGKQLVYRLNQVCENKLQVLNEKKDALQLLSGHTDHCIDFVQNALDNGSDGAVLYSKKTLSRHLNKVKCQRADIPNPEIPVRVQLYLSNVPELQNVISRIGTILVDGKVYPPPPGNGHGQTPPAGVMNNPQLTPQQQAQQQQQQQAQQAQNQSRQNKSGVTSPNVTITTPPLRPGMGGPNAGYNSSPGLYPPNVSAQFASNNMQMGRQFPQDGSPGPNRFQMPLGMGPPQPHVSSSTHPSNMDNLRGLLNHQNAQGFGNHMPGNFGMQQPPNNPSHPMQQMRNNYGNQQSGPPQGHFNPNNGPPMGTASANMSNMAQRYQNFPRFMPPMRPMMPNVKTTGMRFQQPSQMPPGYNGPNNAQQSAALAQQQTSSAAGSASAPGGAKWHIPQQQQAPSTNQNGFGMNSLGQGSQFMGPDTFKIPLKSPESMRQHQNGANGLPTNGTSTMGPPLPNVSSTNPKTPSPSRPDNAKYDEQMDKITMDSVNDLMATIAKLDSNGVQVLPEGRNKATSPQVHSSTDLNDKNQQPTINDPNEDWCAVCMDGGELMCCDKCPKVFHQSCHIPVISSLPDESETWQCLLCFNFATAPPEPVGEKRHAGISSFELKIVQRILLELLCQYEQSITFRNLPPEVNKAYYDIVVNPICFEQIRSKLDPNNANYYSDVQLFIDDCRKLFENAFLFYEEDSKIYQGARDLEKFFDIQLKKLLPKYARGHASLHNLHTYNLQDLVGEDTDQNLDPDYIPPGIQAKRARTSTGL